MRAMVSSVREHRLLIAVGTLATVMVLSLGIWWGYQKYSEAHNRQAQLLLAEQLERFDALRHNTEASPSAWEDMGEGLLRSSTEHQGTSLAPFFLTFASEAYVRSGNRLKALELMDAALARMNASSVLYFLYAMKAAVMRLDSPDPELSGRGKRDLLNIAQDTRASCQGLAWFHLWQYAFVAGDKELLHEAYTKIQIYPDVAQLVRQQSEPLQQD